MSSKLVLHITSSGIRRIRDAATFYENILLSCALGCLPGDADECTLIYAPVILNGANPSNPTQMEKYQRLCTVRGDNATSRDLVTCRSCARTALLNIRRLENYYLHPIGLANLFATSRAQRDRLRSSENNTISVPRTARTPDQNYLIHRTFIISQGFSLLLDCRPIAMRQHMRYVISWSL